jgi:GNAT superfamily N-acetyltransferase
MVTADNIVPLAQYHDRKSFDCGEPPLNDFLVKRALTSLLGSTYVLVGDPNSPEIVAYFTIHPNVICTNDSRPSSAGAVKIEYMAVETKHQRCGLGTELLAYILGQTAYYARTSRIMLAVAEPLNDRSRTWILSRGFGFETAHLPQRCLAVSVETIRSHFDIE